MKINNNIEQQDEIQEDTTSMEEKLAALEGIELSECCGTWITARRECSSCREYC